MSRPITKRIMGSDEFNDLAKKITGRSESWLDRLHDMLLIDKPTLIKYAAGERQIPNSYALFLRRTYLLQRVYPDLANDINLLSYSPIEDENTLPSYNEMATQVSLTTEVKKLKTTLLKIEKIAKNSSN